MAFAPVEKLIEAIRKGQTVLLVDDEGRENEGDFIVAAEHATAENIGLMARLGRGLICAPVAPAIADRLALSPMVSDDAEPEDPIGCAFTVSVDARDGITTGISAHDRALTARLLSDPATKSSDLRRPGHIFPLRAKPGGVLERAGHTEAAIDLARLAGCTPAGVICEVMADDGTMMRVPELEKLAESEDILLGSIEDLIAYRKEHDASPAHVGQMGIVRHQAVAKLPTPFGQFAIHVFANERKEEIVALCLGDLRASDPVPLTRIHSACFTGDVLNSLRCDCGGQLHMALQAIGEAGHGIVVYLPQEGRGIGLAKKIEAYQLQEYGLDTVEANEKLGFPADLRTYEDAAAILGWFGVRKVRLLTNNPAKIQGLEDCGIEITERVSVEPGPGPVNHAYLKTKKGKLGHFFEAV